MGHLCVEQKFFVDKEPYDNRQAALPRSTIIIEQNLRDVCIPDPVTTIGFVLYRNSEPEWLLPIFLKIVERRYENMVGLLRSSAPRSVIS